MAISASLIILTCPACGAKIIVMGMNFPNEPPLYIKDCESCRTKLQVRKDLGTGKLVIEKQKVS